MTDRSASIFGNPMPDKVRRKAASSKAKYARKFGDDSARRYPVTLVDNPHIGPILGVRDIRVGEKGEGASFDLEKGLIVGNIRMGFGHYRIAMAMASAAHAMGYQPYWMDLNSYPETTCTKVISAQNDLYSMGSRLSQKSRLFNKFFWEPMNYEGFRKLSYNASDQKNAELMAPVFGEIPKQIPVIGTHVWPAQAALHAGMKHVVCAIPDNWPMALHLAEGGVHTVQTHYAYQGYRILNGMNGRQVLRPMPDSALRYVGHYIDDELVKNIESDCDARLKRKDSGAPLRLMLTIGGAGAQKEIFRAVICHLIPALESGKAALYVNVGDYQAVWEELRREIPALAMLATEHMNDWDDTRDFAARALSEEVCGVHAFWHENIFQAVYATNLLMRSCDVLLTKPGELAYYPVPKLFIRRIGGHEQWGAIHSAEIGDGTLECRDIPHTLQMVDLFLNDGALLRDMCGNIVRNKKIGIYDGAYETVKIAMGMKNQQLITPNSYPPSTDN